MGVRWSKLKHTIEDRFADRVQGRAALHATRYGPGLSAAMARAWITWDGVELLNASTIEWLQASRSLMQREQIGFQAARAQLQQAGHYSRDDVVGALEHYVTLSIGEAIVSPTMLIRALAMLDRRLGKRRLQEWTFEPHEHPLVRQLYVLRCSAEGIVVPEASA